jgi:hypothetical protein
MATSTFSEPTSQKQELLLAFYKTSSDEASWRRTAGYRTVILGLGYCGVILTVVASHPIRSEPLKISLAAVIGLAAVFGSGYLVSNYEKYMSAVKRMVLIEEQFGAFNDDFLGALGPLMPAGRRSLPAVPLIRNPICIWSIVAFAAGGLITAAAILMA